MVHENSDMLIIITSDEPWSKVWHTQLHYANQLSKYFKVIYMNPPGPWKLKNIFGIGIRKTIVNHRLTIIPYHNLLPVSLGNFAKWINDVYNEKNVMSYELLKNFKFSRKIIWHFDPFRAYYFFMKSRSALHVYHVIDPFYNHELDVPLAKRADLVVVTSPKFLEYYKKHSSNTMLIKQGVDLNFYKSNLNFKTPSLQSSQTIILLGTLTDHIDFEILQEILDQLKVSLIIIGPNKLYSHSTKEQFKKLIESPGCKWLGAMDPVEYRTYLESATLGIIVYNNKPGYFNNQRSPLKVISYLSANLPVITNIDSEIPELTGRAIYYAEDGKKYLQLVRQGLEQKLLFDKELVSAYLESINYPVLLNKIFSNLGIRLPAPIEN